MAKLKQSIENELPFELLKLLPQDKSSIRWNELERKYRRSPYTLSKYLRQLCDGGLAKKTIDDTRKGSPPAYAITDAGLKEMGKRKPGQPPAIRKRRLLAVANRKLELNVHPVMLEYRWSKIQERQNQLRPAVDVGRPIDFHAFPVTASSMILVDQNTARDPYKLWKHAVRAESSTLRVLCEQYLDSILQARYDEISEGKPTQNFREEYERIRKAMDLEAELVIRFSGRHAFNFEKEVKQAEQEKKMDLDALSSFKKELLDPSKRIDAVQALVARILERNEGDITVDGLIDLVANYWKDGGLPTTGSSSLQEEERQRTEILQFLRKWKREGITEIDAEEKIELIGSIANKTSASADSAIMAIAHLSSLVPPWGTRRPEA